MERRQCFCCRLLYVFLYLAQKKVEDDLEKNCTLLHKQFSIQNVRGKWRCQCSHSWVGFSVHAVLVNHDEHFAACDSDQFVSTCPLSDGVRHYLRDYRTTVSFIVEVHRKHTLFNQKKCSRVHSGQVGSYSRWCFCWCKAIYIVMILFITLSF